MANEQKQAQNEQEETGRDKEGPIPCLCPFSLNLSMTLTFPDLAMEVDGIHRGSDNVGVAVPSCHNASDLIHELHGDTCSKHTHAHRV